jgi:hypothetical protein
VDYYGVGVGQQFDEKLGKRFREPGGVNLDPGFFAADCAHISTVKSRNFLLAP